MNLWTQKSIELAAQSNYLDQLYRVYPMSVNLRRELSASTQNEIRTHLNNQDGKNLLHVLLKQEIFPIKDSYVAYLKRDKTAIERNPATVSRLAGMLIEMGFDEILDKTTVPKETNRQIGPLFKNWIASGALGVPVTDNAEEFLNYQGNIVFNAGDNAMKAFAEEYLGYRHHKGLDFIAKFNHQFIIGEAKFLTDFGGHQNAQFNDAVATMQAPLTKTNHTVRTIAILDGVLYIKGKNKMFNDLNNFKNNEIVVSAVLLRDYLFSV
jgi:type II site-specific deoxyribonuclease